MGKVYHNTTARYNGYFNAKEIMLATFESLDLNHQDNYNKLLPVYIYEDPKNLQTYSADLDKAIEKVTRVVNLHRPSYWVDDCYFILGQAQYLKQDYEGAEQTFRYLINEYPPEKFEKKKKGSKDRDELEDEEDLRKSKAQVKRDRKRSMKQRKKEAKRRAKARKRYNKQVRKNRLRRSKGKKAKAINKPGKKEESEETVAATDSSGVNSENPTLEPENIPPEEDSIGMISIFDNPQEDDVESDPESYFLKHRPRYQEGMLWLAKSLVARDNYDAADRYMNRLEKDPGTFEDVRRDLAVLKAYYYIKQDLYKNAVPALEKAVELSNDRDDRARYSFIAAQISQMNGDSDAAYAGFERVIKLSSDYEMEFSARLNLAQSEWLNGKTSQEEILKRLEKMLKDAKNIGYKDRIYYTMAGIYLKSGNKPEAIKYLQLALQHGGQNRIQKADSYYQLAELYFEAEEFVTAKNYYDSTLQVLDKTDERYVKVENSSKSLKNIAKFSQEVELQDSLLRISELSEEDKKVLAFEIKRQQQEEKRAALAAAANRANSRTNNVRAAATNALQKESSWFAYDDKALKRGEREFDRRWGSRVLEDNWRVSDKSSNAAFEEEEEIEEIASAALTDEDVATILKDVPKNRKEKEVARLKIKTALFSLGKAFRDDLGRNDKAAEVLEELNKKYPGNPFELDSWYYLYLAYTDLNNSTKQQHYKDLIVSKFPSSNYAQVLQNPNYLAELEDEEQQLNAYYDAAYSDFSNQKYQRAYEKIQNASDKFGSTNLLQPRFALLSAMCLGQIKGKDAYLEALKEVIARYPNSPEQKRAREIMRLLGGPVASLPGGATDDGVNSDKFKLEEDKSHYILVVFNGDVKTNDKKRSISDYNRKYHKLDKLGLTAMFLNGSDKDDRKPLIVIRRFKDKASSMLYYDGVQNNLTEFMSEDDGIPFDVFAVSLNNYRQILRSRSIAGYREFFDAYYLEKRGG